MASVFAVAAGTPSGGSPTVEVKTPHGTFLYPLDQNRDLHETGPAGVTWLRIQDGQVFAIDSPGPRKIMMRMGKISRQGEWIASVPNHVFVVIIGGSPPELDVKAY